MKVSLAMDDKEGGGKRDGANKTMHETLPIVFVNENRPFVRKSKQPEA